MKKKNKSESTFNEKDFAGSTIETLMNAVIQQRRQGEQEALKQVQKFKKQLAEATKKERELDSEIKERSRIVEKMELDFFTLQERLETEKVKKGQAEEVTQERVKSGEVSIREFYRDGKSYDGIVDKAITETADELSQASELIRANNNEIHKLNTELQELRVEISYMMNTPIRIYQRLLKDLDELITRDIATLMEGMPQAQTRLNKLKEERILIDRGVSLSIGHSWSHLSMKEAKRIEFSPILPSELIPVLRSELAKINPINSTINVTYHWKGKEIDVQVFKKPEPKEEEIAEREG